VVTAVDSSSVALEILEQRALDLHHRLRTSNDGTECEPMHGIQLWQADLEEVSLHRKPFSLVIA